MPGSPEDEDQTAALRDARSARSSGTEDQVTVPEEWTGEERSRPRLEGAAVTLSILAGAALIAHLVALYLPGTPDGSLELPWLPGADKVVHLLLFGVPTYLFGRLTRRVGLVAGLFAVHAVVSELVQWRFVPYRDGDPFDALADLVGIGLAVLLLRRERRPGR